MSKWILEVRTPEGVRVVELHGPLVIGRDADADVVVDDLLVSRRHCVVSPDEGHCRLDATGSKNGVLVRGRRLDKTLLRPGDMVSIGSTRLRLRGPSVDPEATITQNVLPREGFKFFASTRELVDASGNRLAVFGAEEAALFESLVRTSPLSATFSSLGEAVWNDPMRESYALHQLAYKLRRQLRGLPISIESNKGVGYCLDGEVQLA